MSAANNPGQRAGDFWLETWLESSGRSAGEFDRHLTRPLSPLLQIASSTLELNRFGDLVGGLALFGVSIIIVKIAWSPVLAILVVLSLIGGILAESALTLAIAALTFRRLATDSIWYLIQSSFGNYGN